MSPASGALASPAAPVLSSRECSCGSLGGLETTASNPTRTFLLDWPVGHPPFQLLPNSVHRPPPPPPRVAEQPAEQPDFVMDKGFSRGKRPKRSMAPLPDVVAQRAVKAKANVPKPEPFQRGPSRGRCPS